MSDEMNIGGKQYVSSKRASELSGYAQDYIGQLARSGQIDAQRVGGLWHVLMDSLLTYKQTADMYKPEPPQVVHTKDPESLITFDGKDYVSAVRAAKITGYNQDYVGQLARGGKILSRQVGNRWYVEREGILAHKREKDSLLASVQAESVGLVRAERQAVHVEPEVERKPLATPVRAPQGPFLTYTPDNRTLVPRLTSDGKARDPFLVKSLAYDVDVYQVPAPTEQPRIRVRVGELEDDSRTSGIPIFNGTILASLLLLVAVTLGGYYALISRGSMVASVESSAGTGKSDRGTSQKLGDVFVAVGNVLEDIIIPEIVYFRNK
jgi:hypothetical protein